MMRGQMWRTSQKRIVLFGQCWMVVGMGLGWGWGILPKAAVLILDSVLSFLAPEVDCFSLSSTKSMP